MISVGVSGLVVNRVAKTGVFVAAVRVYCRAAGNMQETGGRFSLAVPSLIGFPTSKR